MKKVCLILVLFSFISVMPCFALKLIVNETTDRTVPSRCSGSINSYEEEPEIQQQSGNIQASSSQHIKDVIPGYQGAKYELVFKPRLGADIRPELVGTTWGYPDYKNIIEQNIQERTTEDNKNLSNNHEQELITKRYLREAADYYVIDTINRPNEIVPVGFETVVHE